MFPSGVSNVLLSSRLSEGRMKHLRQLSSMGGQSVHVMMQQPPPWPQAQTYTKVLPDPGPVIASSSVSHSSSLTTTSSPLTSTVTDKRRRWQQSLE